MNFSVLTGAPLGHKGRLWGRNMIDLKLTVLQHPYEIPTQSQAAIHWGLQTGNIMLLVKALFYCFWVDKQYFLYLACGLAISVWELRSNFHSLWFYCFSLFICFFLKKKIKNKIHTILELNPFIPKTSAKQEIKLPAIEINGHIF